MASPAAVLSVLVKADGVAKTNRQIKDTDKALDKADKTTGRFGKGLSKLGGAAKIGAAGGLALAAVAVKEFVKAAVDAEVSQKRMEAQLKALGINYKAHEKQIDRVIQKHSRLSGLDDEDLQDSFTNIVRVTGDVNQALKLNGLAADFARAKQIDVAKAGELIGKVAGGNTGILARYGIVLKDNATTSDALAVLQTKFAGQAKAYGDTAAGAQDKIGVAIENLKETIGAKLLPAFASVAQSAAKFIQDFESGEGAAGKLRTTISTVFGGIAGVINRTITDIRGWFTEHREDINGVIAAVRNIASAIREAFEKVALPVIQRVLPAIRQIVSGVFTTIGGLVRTLAALLTGRFGEAWKGVKEIFNGALQVVLGLVRASTAPFREAVARIGQVISDAFSGAWDRVRDGVRAVRGWLGERFESIREAAGKFGQGVKDAIVGAFKGAANAVIRFINAIIDAVNALPGVPNIGKIRELAAGGVNGMAHGGAYRRTGGLVSRPMVMMGEEAPRHPEYVIPTNPAYRGRARALLMQAMGAVGFQAGGRWGIGALQALWQSAGGAAGVSRTMALIATAESGVAGRYGVATARNPSGASGLWQILGQLVPGNIFDPFVNARNAVAKYRLQGLSAWDASRHVWGPLVSGGGGGGGRGILEDIGDVIGSVLGALPGVGDLPSWIRGLGEHVLEKITGWIRAQFAGVVGGGAGIGGQVSGTMRMAQTIARKFGLRITSGYRTPEHNRAVGGVEGSLHTHGTPANPGAIDLVGSLDAMNAALVWAKQNLNLVEALIHDAGSGLHLHLGFFRHGGMASGWGMVGEDGPELVRFPAGSRVYPAAQSRRMGAGVVIERALIGSPRAAHVFADRLAWRIRTT